MTDNEFFKSITSICKALKDSQRLYETYRSAWQSEKNLNDRLSAEVTRLEAERDRLKEQLEKAEYIEDGGARNAR